MPLLLPVVLQAEALRHQVTTQPLGSLWVQPTYSAPATVVQDRIATLSAEVGGQLLQLPQRVGEPVAAGALLAQIDCRHYEFLRQRSETELEALKVQLDFAKQQLQRAESLTTNMAEEQRQQRQMQATLLQVQYQGGAVAVAQAKLDQQHCQITAPYAGVVVANLVAVGELVSPGTPLLRLLPQQRAEVEALVLPDQLALLRESEAIIFSGFNRLYPLQLRAVLPWIEAPGRSQQVRLSFSDAVATPGESGRLEWRSLQHYLPARYLLQREQAYGVMLAVGGKAVFVPLPEALEGRLAALDLALLNAASEVITSGAQLLQNGDLLEITRRDE
ncbi:MAG: efflux RND transporter periplasmic adaptor subunit [Gammaproteobacteria bacterium]|nr:efflux RND transporter periplasmic adaptor subunit [Gammaproteobacteria bacterium]